MNKLLFMLIIFYFSNLLWASDETCKKRNATQKCAYNPKPSEGDILLPMPSGKNMVFKKIMVPGGSSYWATDKRIIKLGDISGASKGTDNEMYEPYHRGQYITGSFYDKKLNSWYYLLGKYEVSIGQYIDVMGQGDKKKGLAIFLDQVGNKQTIKALKKALKSGKKNLEYNILSQPIESISKYMIDSFIRSYNLWCFKDTNCKNNLPYLYTSLTSNKKYRPGFLRLPTEVEWEFAARGGVAALNNKILGIPVYERELPISKAELMDYAVIYNTSKTKVQQIGSLKPIYGLYDMFGNVAELCQGSFLAEMIQGKVGALVARGGDLEVGTQLRSSFREEVVYFRKKGKGNRAQFIENKQKNLGFRLMIGSQDIVNSHFMKEIKKTYDKYALSTTRSKTTVGDSRKGAGEKTDSHIDDSKKEIERLLAGFDRKTAKSKTSFYKLKSELKKVHYSLERASKNLAKYQRQIAQEKIFSTSRTLIYAMQSYHQYSLGEKKLKYLTNRKIETSTTRRSIKRLTRLVKKRKKLYNQHKEDYIIAIRFITKEISINLIQSEVSKLKRKKSTDKKYIQLMYKHIFRAKKEGIKAEKWFAEAENIL